MASLDVDEYNRAVEATTKAVQQLGLDDDEEGFPALPKLNIGGTEFQTRIDVLRSQPGSLLSEFSPSQLSRGATRAPWRLTLSLPRGRLTSLAAIAPSSRCSRRVHGRGGVRVRRQGPLLL